MHILRFGKLLNVHDRSWLFLIFPDCSCRTWSFLIVLTDNQSLQSKRSKMLILRLGSIFIVPDCSLPFLILIDRSWPYLIILNCFWPFLSVSDYFWLLLTISTVPDRFWWLLTRTIRFLIDPDRSILMIDFNGQKRSKMLILRLVSFLSFNNRSW